MPASSSNNAELGGSLSESELATERSIQELARRAERAIHEGIESLRSQSRGYADTAAERFDTTQRYVVDRVHERPLTSTLAALGVGVLVGFLLSGRRN
jgi:ElaB/YqjD/DUF883 family membrane-anchored ribosome-binding protein